VVKIIDKGYRLPPPPSCPKRVYSLMMDCWYFYAFFFFAFNHILYFISRDKEKQL